MYRACEVGGGPPPSVPECFFHAAAKELSVLDFVKRRTSGGDLDEVLRVIEQFASERLWLKITGGNKARLVAGCLRPGDRVMEFGAYVGYSSLSLVRQLRRLGGGGQMISCEVDAANAHVAREMAKWAGAEGEARLHVGRASDWLASGKLGKVDVLLLDHRGTIYHEDLQAAAPLVATGTRVVADNVLLPGAPLFLSYIQGRFSIAVHDVPEYMRPELDDWIIVCVPVAISTNSY